MITYLRLKKTLGHTTGTFGVFMEEGIPFAVGLEPAKPIIPQGMYSVSWYISPRRKTGVYLIKGVVGHSGVEIHIGNQVTDSTGCILIGQGYGKSLVHGVTGDGVIDSRLAFNLLIDRVGKVESWKLHVVAA